MGDHAVPGITRGLERVIDASHRAVPRLTAHPYFLAADLSAVPMVGCALLAHAFWRDLSWWRLSAALLALYTVGYPGYLAVKDRVLGTASRSLLQDTAIFVIPGFLILSALLRQPLGPACDYLALALPGIMAVHRAGCLFGGCCYGRPHPSGIRYHPDQVYSAATRWRRYQAGPCPPTRVFQLQVADAAVHLALLAGLITLAAADRAPIPLLPLYLMAYSSARLVLDFHRGHRHRPVYGPLSEAQWTAALTIAACACWLTVVR